ncbi:hypothetical protein OBBRIDRAFT_558927 [Obba rivulosa]|uniref:RNA polymerase II assembly factor Rtp1 C-terminal domain-containing protein n=1 Tax=Obba rivulosa TaxID=1052685 RepID=A0A8E2AZ98_9APHY|nr:hypothetical protein OBBRIDRAFT_558927 [Obba rivulosa]
MHTIRLETLLHAGSYLAGSSASESASNLEELLQKRLTQYHTTLGEERHEPVQTSRDNLQLETATQALRVIELIHDQINPADASLSPDAVAGTSKNVEQPEEVALGTRDLAHIKTLISISLKWGVEPLLARVIPAIPTKVVQKDPRGAKIIDLTGVPDDYATLTSFVTRFLRLLFPAGSDAPMARTPITSALLNQYFTDLLRASLVLGWLPKNLVTESVQPVDAYRPLVLRILSILPASQAIAALGGLLSNAPALGYVRKTCGILLSRQLLRPEGITGLFTVMFAEEDFSGGDAPLEKLEQIARLLCAVPSGMTPENYFSNIVPRLLFSLSDGKTSVPPVHRRAVAFTLSRILATEEANPEGVVSSILLPLLHRPFLHAEMVDADPSSSAARSVTGVEDLTVSASLETMQNLLTNMDPSPSQITRLLTPIVPSLYSISYHLDTTKTSDPAQRETVKSFLATWGRIVGFSEGQGTLWLIIGGSGGDWRSDIAGNIKRVQESGRVPSLSLFTPETLQRAEDAGELDVDANLLDLKPDPVHFVRFLGSLKRSDVTSDIFVKLLEAYRELRSDPDADPLRTLLYLQLIVQMQSQLSSDDPASSLLKKPDHILSFIKHALESDSARPVDTRKPPAHTLVNTLRMEDLRIVSQEEEELEGGDSDDEGDDTNGSSDREMVVTALNLLLSILEAHPDLSARTTPILNEIFSLLEPLAKDPSDTIRPVAREARMVMTARLASTSMPHTAHKAKKTPDEESPQEIYQKALKLLQDPILPVRAHGLLLLRQLVSARRTKSGAPEEPSIDRALVPAILSIFLQSLQDDDSYMFLNAVQGLSAMVDGFGKDVLKGLVDMYTQGLQGLGGTSLTQQDVDSRTRIGEALAQVIRRYGDTLPAHAYLLVSPLFAVVRTSHFPTALRTSAISLLAQCAQTSLLALIPYMVDLTEGMLDLLQVETVRAPPQTKSASTNAPAQDFETSSDSESEPKPPTTMDAQPTSMNPKFPPMRRAALHFLSLLIRASTKRVYESDGEESIVIPVRTVNRAKTTLGYIAVTDEDSVVRVMAREAVEELDQLKEAVVGL